MLIRLREYYSLMNRNSLPSRTVIIISALLLVALLAPIPIPQSISGKAVLQPATEWLLIQHPNHLSAETIRHATGMRSEIRQIRFSRGNSINLRFANDLLEQNHLTIGDTVLFLDDSDLRAIVISTQRKLDVARANLDVKSSGSKPELIREARAKLDLAIQQDIEQKQLTERSRALFESDLISKEEYELANSK